MIIDILEKLTSQNQCKLFYSKYWTLAGDQGRCVCVCVGGGGGDSDFDAQEGGEQNHNPALQSLALLALYQKD